MHEVILAQNRRPVEKIQEFPHITRIIVFHQRGKILFRQMLVMPVDPPAVRNVTNVVLVFTERRNAKFHHIQSLKQILAETAWCCPNGETPMPNEHRSQGCHCRKYIDEISRNARLEEEVARLKRENSRLREQLGRVRRTALEKPFGELMPL